MADPKFKTPPQAPPLFTHTSDSIISETERLNAEYKKVLDDMVAAVKPETATFATTLKPILVDDDNTAALRRILNFYQHVSPKDELRDASRKADEITNDFDIECKMREDVFKVVDGAYQQRESEELDSESLRVLEKERKKFVRNGLLIPHGPQRDRFKEIQKRLSQLCIECQKNLNEDKSSIWFAPSDLDGVPEDDIAIGDLEKGTGENEGKVKLGFKYNHFFPLVKYAKNAETRHRYIVADANKANHNVPMFQEIIELRDEAARILGYPDHASLKIEEKMAKTPARVSQFLDDLRERLAAGGKKDVEKLLEYKKNDYAKRGIPFDGSFYMWDTSYYSRLMKEQEYSVDEVKVSQYFPVESTFNGMLEIFEEIFGFEFVEVKEEDRRLLSPTGKAEDIVWHDEVRVYTVWNDEAGGGEFVGYLYIDLHPRDGKYSHNANFNLEPGYLRSNGSRNYPATALVCNFSKPSANKPSLLKHNEVVTLFHELGHGIHDLAGRTRYSYFHGTNVVNDFVEAPSQMLENWCWTPSVLKSLSRHWETGESIPDDLVTKLISTKNLNSATANLAQLLIGTFDMTIHTPKSHDDIKKLNAGQLWNQLRHDISGIKGPEDVGEGITWGNRHANIGHFIGGYDAGYYGYLWSEVFSTDMFHSVFKKNPMSKEEGRRYRKVVLEKGGSVDEMEFLREFLGREPSTEPFYQELGLV
ncbi:hypothetical protein GMORB2_0256 [Geosmithia morbida]|uniref:Peptidase M3A/M3B catalytic domain-containing protein n=1 Tax=Geosmithia morbida TaxID=1094350 RepID=A0A9P4Z2I5_9HYPO|nr:uncharacterized protein GMORB2_0256 [Geosmithia morbida]KAF4126520.1 hypothetical protein GMORB2_0256 [Geosmithia morbida]